MSYRRNSGELPYMQQIANMRLHNADCGVRDELINHRDEALFRRMTGRFSQFVGFELPMGAGAALQNCTHRTNLIHATQRFGILGGQLQNFLKLLFERDHGALGEIDQASVKAVAHGAPTILANQHRCIRSPALIG